MFVLVILLVTVAAPAAAQTPERDAIAVVGLLRVETIDGQTAVRVEEPQRRRERLAGALRAPDQPVLDHAELRDILGAGYLSEFVACRGEPACVAGIAAPLGARVRLAVYGEYEVLGDDHRFWLRAVDVRDRRLIAESRFTLQTAELDDEGRWRRELAGLLAQATGGAPAPAPAPGGDPVQPPPPDGEPPELPPLTTGEPTGTTDGGDGTPTTGGSVGGSILGALARGVLWHGYLQLYAAAGVREPFRPDLLVFENRLQLELKSDVGPLRIVGRPELVFDGLREELGVSFRELFAARDYEKLEISIGERILTWGVTDFWPVVDILNPRDLSRIRNWRPIDEKRPAPVVQATAVLGRVTLQAIGIILARSSVYQLDQARPFAIPIAVPPSIPISQEPVPRSLESSGGGVAADVTLGSWKTSLYALWGRDPLPTIFARVDPMTGAPEVRVANERVAMVAASARGTIDSLDALIKAEAAYYLRIDDRCEDATEVAPGTPSCFYLRRIPTARATAAIERRVVSGLDAHLQLIGEVTRRADVPALPDAAMVLAPGLRPQHRFNPIATLRLQGRWARDDFRPSAFIYWSLADQDWFINLDLEYHIADGFALAIGGFWFQGYADDPAENRFTFAGALESSSHGYLRATAWF